MLWKVTIIWRPNVGKSSFFNMFVGHKIAITSDTPGTTRDIVEYEYTDKDNDLTYIIADSWWLELDNKHDDVAKDIVERTQKVIKESEILIWLIEYDRIIELDEEILKVLRKNNYSSVVVIANKADNESRKMEALTHAWIWWYEHFYVISTLHNEGIREVRKCIADLLTQKWLNYNHEIVDDDTMKLTLVWRPNVWKSSILNAITWENRVMVQDFSGTTRDSIDVRFEFEWEKYVLIDTAWLRKPGKIWTRNIENWSLMRTERAISRSDVIWIVIDGFEWIAHQDKAIISLALKEHKWIVLIVNKWDLVLAKDGIDKNAIMWEYLSYLKNNLEFLPWVSVVFVSATEKRRVEEIIKRVKEVMVERKKRISTSLFNTFIEKLVYKHPPSGNKKSHKPKIYYGSQVDTNPPKFLLSVNNSEHFHFSYPRYIENNIREEFGFGWTPIIIELKGRKK